MFLKTRSAVVVKTGALEEAIPRVFLFKTHGGESGHKYDT